MEPKEKYANFRGVTTVQVLRIEVNEGNGTTEDPIYREVYYCTLDGKIIGHDSPHGLRKFAGN